MNDTTPQTIAESFSTHAFEQTYDYLDENIVWNNIGGDLITGKVAVVEECNKALDYFASVTSNLQSLISHIGNDSVTVETLTSYTEENDVSTVASCDIYTFTTGKISAITSYNVEVTP